MKKIFYLLVPALLALIATGCNGDEIDITGSDVRLTTDTEDILAPYTGETLKIEVTSNVYWTAGSNSNWCRLDKAVGHGDETLTVTIDPNDDFYPREALVTLVADAGRVVLVIPVYQPAETYQWPSTLTVGPVPAPQKIFVEAETSWSVVKKEVASDGTDWLTVTPDEGTRAAVVTVTIEVNRSDARSMDLEFTVDGAKKSVRIEQQKGELEEPVVTLADGNALTVNWQPVEGAEGYEVVAYDPAGNPVASSGALSAATLSYDLAAMPEFDRAASGADFYAGTVTVRVKGLTNDPTLFSISDPTAPVHSHFDTASGDGSSETSAYILTSARHLNNVRLDLSGHYKLAADINLTGFSSPDITDNTAIDNSSNFAPILAFTGTFDGAKSATENYEIVNLKITKATAPVGIFGTTLEASVVKNVTVRNPEIVCTLYNAANNTGTLVGNCQGATGGVYNCHVIGGSVRAEGNNIGGLVGQLNNSKSMEDCSNTGTNVTVGKGGTAVGGLVGISSSNGTIIGCTNSGTVTSYGASGGICGGANAGGAILYCNNSGRVVNLAAPGDLGEITAANTMSGGIVARMFNAQQFRLENCYNTGDIEGSYFLGGVCGKQGGINITVRDCYNTGKITVKQIASETAVGGVLGTINTNGTTTTVLENCYAAGQIVLPSGASPTAKMGAVIGEGSAALPASLENVKDVFFLNTTLAGNSLPAVGTNSSFLPSAAKSDADLKKQATFTNWDFTAVWTIDEGVSYPELRPAP